MIGLRPDCYFASTAAGSDWSSTRSLPYRAIFYSSFY
jgi:hypothetical protein